MNNTAISLDSQSCALAINGEQIEGLALKPQCHFVKVGDSHKIHVEHYEDINAKVVVMVGNSVRNNADFPLTQTRKDCGSQLQAIIIPEQGDARLSEVMVDTITCAGIGIDEKEFWILAH